MDPSELGRRGSLQLLECSSAFALRGKERLGTSKSWIPQDQLNVIACNYLNVPVPLLCEAKKG